MLKRLKLMIVLVFLQTEVLAAENLFLSGAEVTTDASTYFYLGTAIPLPGSTLAKGYAVHLWTDYLTYSYETDKTIDASIHSMSVSLGYHDSGHDHWWNTRLGLVQSNTRLKPGDAGNDNSGSQTNIKVQAEGEKRLTDTYKMIGNAEYILGRGAYWLRGRFLTRNEDATYDGPELIYQGDDSYSAYQLGWVLAEIPYKKHWDVTLKTGLRFDENATSVYAGIELSRPY